MKKNISLVSSLTSKGNVNKSITKSSINKKSHASNSQTMGKGGKGFGSKKG